MEVILKKVKITSSILNQVLILKADDLKSFEVLGYCVLKNDKWIVLYNASTNELRKTLMFKEVLIDNGHSSPFHIKVIFPSKYAPRYYDGKNDSDCQEFIKLMNQIKHQAEEKGQFFI